MSNQLPENPLFRAPAASASYLPAARPSTSVHDVASAKAKDARLEAILQRINGRVAGTTSAQSVASSNLPPASSSPAQVADFAPASFPAPASFGLGAGHAGAGSISPTDPDGGRFLPIEPKSFRDAGMSETDVEALLLKYLIAIGDATGRDAAEHLRLPFTLIDEQLRRLKQDQFVVYRATAAANDFVYELTDLGRERARRYVDHCTYYGSAPVPLADYIASVKAQSIEQQYPTEDDLRRAFGDLLVNPRMFRRLGPAINSGRGLFLFGPPGNGKTSIAERITRCFGQYLWIPRALNIDGEIMRLFDPCVHEELPLQKGEGLLDSSPIDRRWVRIRRPTVVVGGELTMDNLEVTLNTSTRICESPVQLKSNCGTLVIDDFGRQKMRIDELLNRWIVPLEKRYDYLNMPNGKKIQVPFDQLIVFSTNLEPRDLVDEAFLRRIPFKIEVTDPSEEEFRSLFKLMCGKLGLEHREGPIGYLIDRYYKTTNRPFRACHPRDLLLQVKSHCAYHKRQAELTNEFFDVAAENYFAVM